MTVNDVESMSLILCAATERNLSTVRPGPPLPPGLVSRRLAHQPPWEVLLRQPGRWTDPEHEVTAIAAARCSTWQMTS